MPTQSQQTLRKIHNQDCPTAPGRHRSLLATLELQPSADKLLTPRLSHHNRMTIFVCRKKSNETNDQSRAAAHVAARTGSHCPELGLETGSRMMRQADQTAVVTGQPISLGAYPGQGWRASAIAAVVIAGCLASPSALAQQRAPAPQAAPESDTVGLEEIVVTARKREENLQDTPLSVVAFSAAALEARQVTSVADVGQFTPNLVIDSAASLAGSSSTMTMFIRGIGQSDFNLTIDPGVGLYLDGVYISRSVGALLDTVDIERVEVLRGPQGTLFGKNTIGGALVLTSQAPRDTLAASLEATTGSYNRIDVKGMLNIPVSDRFAIRATGSLQKRDGYVRRILDGDTLGDKNALAGRIVAQWRPTDNLTLTASIDGTRNREESKPATLLDVTEMADFVSFWNFAVNGATCFTPPQGLPVPNRPRCFNDQWITKNPYTTFGGGGNFSNLDLWGLGLTVEWDVGPVSLKSITSYRDMTSSFTQDYDNSPLPIGETANIYTQSQVSQEFQATGTAFDDRLKWLVGVYYLNEKGNDENNLTFSIADFRSGGKVNNGSFAVFSQLTYAVTDALSLTLGGRYNYEKKRFLPEQFIRNDRTGGSVLALSRLFIPTNNPNGNLILPRTQAATTANEFTPAVTLDYKVSDSALIYASFSKGFKSGGFTQRVFPPEAVIPSFGPEFVESYEVGLKSEWFDRRLRLNLAAFYADYSGLQIIVNQGVAPKVRNAGKAHVQGFEMDFEAVLTNRVQLSGGLGYTDAGYDQVDPLAAGITKNNRFGNVPQLTGTLGLSARLLDLELGSLTARGDFAYRSGHFKDAVNTPLLFQKAYGTLNASLTFDSASDRWSASFGATNLTDQTYLITGYQDSPVVGVVTGTYARPREWFLKGKVRF
jgi:iron complex outermembrane recepter protein